MQRICYLHEQKGYKPESLFSAASVFDYYLQTIGMDSFPKDQIITLATISVLMSAKLEQPISPSFSRMVGLLSEDEKRIVNKKGLIKLEEAILKKFGFDFNFQSPICSLERYLRLLNYDLEPKVFSLCFQILKASLTVPSFLAYPPSKMAACAAIIAINIFEKDREDKFGGHFSTGDTLNTDLWNHQTVHKITGYAIEDIKICLYELANFCSNQLKTK